MDGDGYQSRCDADKMLLSDALLRYAQEISLTNRGHIGEVIRINALKRTKMVGFSMAKLSPGIVAGFRHESLKGMQAGAVIREPEIHERLPRLCVCCHAESMIARQAVGGSELRSIGWRLAIGLQLLGPRQGRFNVR